MNAHRYVEIEVECFPDCDLCRAEKIGRTSRYDALTLTGQWAFLCEEHFNAVGIGLGEGLGQRLVERNQEKS